MTPDEAIRRILGNPAAFSVLTEDWIDDEGREHIEELAILDERDEHFISPDDLGPDREWIVALIWRAQLHGNPPQISDMP